MAEGDLPEGTIIRIDASRCVPRHRNGRRKFTNWDMLTTHSCEPNLVYNDDDSDEEEDWRSAYATRDIKTGELLTVDFNCMEWDRASCACCSEDGTCHCNSARCTGTIKGLKFLRPEDREERKLMSWEHKTQDTDGVKKENRSKGGTLLQLSLENLCNFL